MFKHYFEQIEGIGMYPLISLIVFFVFFVGLSIWLFRTDTKRLSHLSSLPLEEPH